MPQFSGGLKYSVENAGRFARQPNGFAASIMRRALAPDPTVAFQALKQTSESGFFNRHARRQLTLRDLIATF